MLDILEIEERQVVTCYRAGAKRENGDPRLLIVTLETPSLAEHFHNYGGGHKIERPEGKKDFWINQDLIKADRDANYHARKLMREKRAQLEEKRKNKTVEKETKKPITQKIEEPKQTNEQKKNNVGEAEESNPNVSTDAAKFL